MKNKEKLVLILKEIKKLGPSRQAYWLSQIKGIQSSKELGDLVSAKTGKPVQATNWLSEFANWMSTKTSDAELAIANKLDSIYQGVVVEVKDVADKSTKALGTGLTNITSIPVPYLFLAGAALVTAYYIGASWRTR